MKKCPPGVICIENVTMGLVFVVIMIVVYVIYKSVNPDSVKYNKNSNYEKIVIQQPPISAEFAIPNYPYNNLPEDVLLNPYVPPLKDERYFVTGRVPINVSTNIGAVDTTYRQLGILTPLNGTSKDNILPLMGRPLFTNRQKYQYYTISNQHNNVKLPVSVKGRSGTNEYGVDQIFNGDTVYIEGYNDAFRVTTYDTDTIKYLPSTF